MSENRERSQDDFRYEVDEDDVYDFVGLEEVHPDYDSSTWGSTQERPLSEIAGEILHTWKGITPEAKEIALKLSAFQGVQEKIGDVVPTWLIEDFLDAADEWEDYDADCIKAELLGLLEDDEW